MADLGAAIRANFTGKKWSEGIELLERMMAWNEVLHILNKAEGHFNLGFTQENGWIYLSIDGKKIEIKGSDFKVLRPMKSGEKERLEVKVFEIEES